MQCADFRNSTDDYRFTEGLDNLTHKPHFDEFIEYNFQSEEFSVGSKHK